MNSESTDGIIRISREEATSSHVDDLLRRQMSLRGEPGVTRDQGRRWYYQNWFVFLVVGLLAAVTAWAIVEPFFQDYIYFQGPIEKAGTGLAPIEGVSRKGARMENGEMNWIQIKGEQIWLHQDTSTLRKDGRRSRLYADDLEAGQHVGVYLEYMTTRAEDVALAYYIVRNPPPQSRSHAALTLHQLHGRSVAAGFLLFPMVAGLVGLAIGAVDGLICRLPRRALLTGLIGLLVGFIGGFISTMLANLVYSPLNYLAMHQSGEGAFSTVGFVVQMIGRSLGWAMAGLAMGLGQGIALRSKRLLIYGLLGGVVGGLLGGLAFDPIDFLILGEHKPGAHLSRLIGLAVIGASVGGLIGVVELLARDAWLRMTQGPLAGKEFLLFKDVMNIGASPRSDIYLFNDPLVAQQHAIIRGTGDECELEARDKQFPLLLNNRPVQRARLRHGDQVTIGRTLFVFQKRKG
jgi:hypothetical protein